FPITIDFGANGGNRRFDDESSFQKFFANERSVWQFIQQIPRDNPASSLQQLHNESIVAADNLRIQVANNRQPIDAVVNNVRARLPSSKFPLSFSPLGEIVQQVRTEYGERAAIGYLAGALNSRFDANDPSQLDGVMLARELPSATAKRAK